MIIGAHTIIYSKKPDADRAFLRDVLKLTHVDVGEGWLVFSLPPAELAVHPAGKNNVHELYLVCDNVKHFVFALSRRKIKCSPVQEHDWGLLTTVTLPGGGKLGVYEPRHKRPKPRTISKVAKRKIRRAA